ncbi:MAG: formyltransferase family protein [Thermomicrobiaceae bacterium]
MKAYGSTDGNVNRLSDNGVRMIRSLLFFGTRCSFADTVLSRLTESGFSIAARVVPGYAQAKEPFTLLQPRSTATTTGPRLPLAGNARAGDAGTTDTRHPIVAINKHVSPEPADYLAGLGADLAVVCCYPKRLPLALVAAAEYGGINVHPSLLPAYRGPEPLFWIFRNGETESGLTLHRVDASLDTGPIVSQQNIAVPVGMSGDELWNHSATLAGEMLERTLERGQIESEHGFQQSKDGASYQSWPVPADLIIDPRKWDAWRVFHFCRGVIPLGYTPAVVADGLARPVLSASTYVNDINVPVSDSNAAGWSDWIRCKSGQVRLTLGPVTRG